MWTHFLLNRIDSQAKCLHCSALLRVTKGSTKGLHSYPGTDRNDHWGLLEDGLARKGLLYSHGHKNFRLHQGKHFSTIIKLFSIYKAIKTFETKQKIVINRIKVKLKNYINRLMKKKKGAAVKKQQLLCFVRLEQCDW